MLFHCHACHAQEVVPLRDGRFAGSAADFCSTCDEPREESDLLEMLTPEQAMYDALNVLVLDPRTRAYLKAYDPKALEQAERAIRLAEAYLAGVAH
jgi:hypothetical protein